MKVKAGVSAHQTQSPLGPTWVPEGMVLNRFNICLRTLRRWQKAGLPKYKLGKLVLYKEEDLNKLIENGKIINQVNTAPKPQPVSTFPKKANGLPKVISVGIVDDHASATNAYAMLLNNMSGIRAVLEAVTGEQLLDKLSTMADLPNILLLDVDMKPMNGIEVAKRVSALYPTIKIVAFSVKDEDYFILQMISAGACAYLSKEISSAKLKEALYEVHLKGKYKADLSHLYSAQLRNFSKELKELVFTDSEKQFLQLLCDGYNYGQMAEEMKVTVSSINYYHSCIAQKLNSKSQANMVYQAIRLGIVSLRNSKISN